MSRSKSKIPAVAPEVLDEPQPEPGPEPKAISNAQAVRNAMSAGHEKIDAIEAFVRDEYGKEIPRQQISAYKSQTRLKAGEAPTRGRRPRAAIEGYLAPPSRPSHAGQGDLIDALRALKPLVAKVGVDNVKKLAELLG